MRFHLAHIVANKLGHGVNGYKDVIDTVQMGAAAAGPFGRIRLERAVVHRNQHRSWCSSAADGNHREVAARRHCLQFAQAKGWNVGNLKPQARFAAERCRVWDYSEGNSSVWASLDARDVRVVPVGYAPILRRIQKPPTQDIDVLFYGSPGQDRLGAFHFLSQSGLTTVFVCGLYGKARDELIGRSKLIVNINLYDRSKIFEVVRVSYLLANRKAVVADIDADTVIDDDMRSGIKLTTGPELVRDCQNLAADDRARDALEEAGFEAIERGDIRKILQLALGAQPPAAEPGLQTGQ